MTDAGIEYHHRYREVWACFMGWRFLGERSSAGTAGTGVSDETGWKVKATESVADRTAPAVEQPRLVRPLLCGFTGHRSPCHRDSLRTQARGRPVNQ